MMKSSMLSNRIYMNASKRFRDGAFRSFNGSTALKGGTQPTPTSARATTATAARKYAKSRAGSGTNPSEDGMGSMITRGPVSWASLGLITIAAGSAVSYFMIERERRLENAMGKIVSYTRKHYVGVLILILLT